MTHLVRKSLTASTVHAASLRGTVHCGGDAVEYLFDVDPTLGRDELAEALVSGGLVTGQLCRRCFDRMTRDMVDAVIDQRAAAAEETIVLRYGRSEPIVDEPAELVVIPCGAEKVDHAAPARELYSSAHFAYQLGKAEAYAGRIGATVEILSARFGLVGLDDMLPTYDRAMSDLNAAGREDLAERVAAALVELEYDRVRSWLPAAYRAVMARACELAGVELVDELAGCDGIGYQRARMAQLASGMAPEAIGPAEAAMYEDVQAAEAAPAGISGRPLVAELRGTGMTRDLIAAADRLEAAQLAVDDARAELVKLAGFAIEAGKSEAWLSRTTGVRRGTLRSWLGKPAT